MSGIVPIAELKTEKTANKRKISPAADDESAPKSLPKKTRDAQKRVDAEEAETDASKPSQKTPSKKKDAQQDAKPAAQAPASEEPVNLNLITKLPSGLQYKDEEIGSGAVFVGRGSIVSVRYQGMFSDGRVFDSNMPKGAPLTFTIGAGQVIKGMEQGLIGMKNGGKRRLIIPPHLGYGREGSGPIPGGSTLIFDVTCIKLSSGVKTKQ